MDQKRFVNINQFRGWDGKLNIQNLARVTHYEAIQPSTSLAQFLRTRVFANHGEINTYEIRDLALELFLGENAEGQLQQLERDRCLGYTKDVVDEVIHQLRKNAPAVEVCALLGYTLPTRRIY